MRQTREVRAWIVMLMMWSVVSGAALLSAGCASSSTKRLTRESPFTKPAELDALQQRELRSDQLIEADGLRVDRWELSGALPTQVGMVALKAPYDALESALIESASSSANKQLRVTEAMSCVARETARFALTHQGQTPSASVSTFLRHRCGAVAISASISSWTFDLKPGQSFGPEELSAEFLDQVKEVISQQFADSGPCEIGMALEQSEEGQAAVTLVAGSRRVHVEPFRMVPAEDTITIQGEVLVEASQLEGSITQGEYGSRLCAMDQRVSLPRFRMTCPVNRSNKSARVELMSSRESSILSNTIFSQLVWPAGLMEDAYSASKARRVLEQHPVAEGLSEEQVYLSYVNRIREAAGVGPLTLAAAQSEAANALLPNLLDAERVADDASSTKITLGLLAGWDVVGDIIDADLRLQSNADGSILSMIEEIMLSPGGRRSLLSDESATLAVGHLREGSRLAAILLVYDFVIEESYDRRVARAWKSINTARGLAKQPPIKRSKKVSSKAQRIISEKMASGEISYDEGLERFQNVVSFAYGNETVYSFSYLTHDLEEVQLNEELLQARKVTGVVMVTPLKIEGYPWTIYSMIIVVPKSKLK